MTDHEIRFFADDAAVRHVGEGLLTRTLPRAEWTHEAHLASCLWLLVERPDIDPERDLRAIISGYNESVGGVNDETQGYHHTITMAYLSAVGGFLQRTDPAMPLADKVNALLAAPEGRRDWPLTSYSRERLFSVAARMDYVVPDLTS
ncbi:hypothetical protein FPZ24_08775 [Sphingomonas panacisoli]|uniref:Uncharacterized protein n=1 Tax=Sphingomonas panacisoli TaxID=1813879 RepID=A0A5B8LGW3_9SPHN|nr:hypothetical protein [Sphingomonas panacisoli]QDZ07568.1 hypothetical protein FPZ24_08775 [Sphingomonas panacisoli]